MIRKRRLRRIHARYLESSRNVQEGRVYWDQASGPLLWLLGWLSPVPLLSLQPEGQRLLEALEWLEAHCRDHPLNEGTIRTYHRMLGGGQKGGEYRKGRADVLDSRIPRPDFTRVPLLMKQLDLRLTQQLALLDQDPPDLPSLIRVASEVHQRIAFIHPFEDGNGRVARLAMNHLLRRYRAGYVILPPLNASPEHFHALEEAHRGKPDELEAISLRHLHPV